MVDGEITTVSFRRMSAFMDEIENYGRLTADDWLQYLVDRCNDDLVACVSEHDLSDVS